MKNSKKLESGFTLVELIVVVAMMAIVFGALMNVIRPTNQFFNTNEAFKDQIMISAGLTEGLGDEVRYATNVVVLENYVGVPEINADNKLPGDPYSKMTFDSAVLLDNQHVRGANLGSFDPAGTAARRKGALGQLVTFIINGDGIDFTESDFLYGEDYYSDYQYEFSASGAIDENGLSYIDFGVNMSDYVVEGGGFVYGDDPYESSEFLYLKNINLSDSDGYNLVTIDCASSVDDTYYNDLGINRVTAAPGGLTAEQRSYYEKDDAANAHTWILYFKGRTISPAENVTLTFDPMDGGPAPEDRTVRKGKNPNTVLPPDDLPKHGYENLTTDDGSVMKRQFDHWYCVTDGKDYTVAEIQNAAWLDDTEFQAMYVLVDPQYTVTFFDEAGVELQQDTVMFGDSVTPPSVVVPAGYDGVIWKTHGSDRSIIDDSVFSYVTGDIEVEPYFYKNLKVTFYEDDGSVIQQFDVKSGLAFDTYLIPAIERTGYIAEWVTRAADGTEGTPDYAVINDNLDVYAKYTPIPVDKPALTINNATFTPNGSWVSRGIFDLKNDGTAATSSFTITIPMSETISSVELKEWCGLYGKSGVTVSYSGNNVIIKGTGTVLTPGEQVLVDIYILPGTAVTTGEPIVTDVT